MKKIYLAIGAFLLAGAASAQLVESQVGPVKNKHTYVSTDRLPSQHDGNISANAADRGTPYWTEDFSTPSNWMMQNTSNPAQDWIIDTQLPTTLVNQGFDAQINSTSGGNFAYIDSDGAGQNATQNADLIWNGTAIDLTGAPTAALNLEFENYHRIFYETHTVSISTDGGSTWTDYEVNTQYGADVGNYQSISDLANPEVVVVNTVGLFTNFVGGGGTLNNVSVKFNYQGAWDWFWAVDDLRFMEAPAHEQSLSTPAYHDATNASMGLFGYPVEYTIIPTTYSHDIEFAGAISNNGANDEASTNIEVMVMDGATNLYTGVGTDTTLGTGGMYNDTTTTTWTSGGTAGDMYDVVFRADYADYALDDDNTNNLDTANVWITDNILGRDWDKYNGAGLWNGDDGGSPASTNAYEMGYLFEAKSNMDLHSIQVALTPSTDPGAFLFTRVYQVDQATGDFNLVYDGSGTNYGEIELTSADISASPTVTWLEVPIDQGNQQPLSLVQGEWYIAVVGHYGGPEAIVLMNADNTAPQQTVFLLDGTDNTWYYMTSTPMLRMNMNPYPWGVEEEEMAGFTLGQNIPNPTTGNTRIPYTLSTKGDVTLDIVDVTGKVVMTIDNGTQPTGSYNFNINADELSEGIYFYTMTVGQERVTKRMVVTK